MPRNDRRLEDLLGTDHPIVQGPFGGGLSTVRLTAAVADAGGLGSFGAHGLEPERIIELVAELGGCTDRAFAVNLWIPQAGEAEASFGEADVARLRPYYDRFELPDPVPAKRPEFAEQVQALLAAQPPVISFVMGIPPAVVLAEARRRGIVTIGTATTVDEAIALEAAGLDVIVASGSDAGGHRGAFLRPAAVHEG